MLFKSIEIWSGKDWKLLKLKTDSIKIKTRHHIVEITDDDVKKVEVITRKDKNMKSRPRRSFMAFID